MTVLVVSAQAVAQKTGRECQLSQFYDQPRHAPAPGYCCFARKNWHVPGGPKGAGGRMRNALVMLITVPGVQVEGGVRSEVDWSW